MLRTQGIIRPWLPELFLLLLVLIGCMPLRLPGIHSFTPLMDAMILYYFALYYPRAFSNLFILLLGVIKDGLYGYPIGVSSLLLIVLWNFATRYRDMMAEAPFGVVWGGFAVTMLLFAALQWMLFSFMEGLPLPLGAASMQWLLTSATYPFLHAVCDEVLTLAVKKGPRHE